MITELKEENAVTLTRKATDIASLCKEIVVKTACNIQGRKYVKVEGWQSIATAHGCVASCRNVERVEGGFRAIGELRRMSDGALISTAEGFVGEDEPTWFGGDNGRGKVLPKRPDYAIRAMAQTRAISRVCRSAFAHVVVMMDAGLSTTPAEEVPEGGFDNEPRNITPPARQAETAPNPAKEKVAFTDDDRTRFIAALIDKQGFPPESIQAFAVSKGIIFSSEQADVDWPLHKLPAGKAEFAALCSEIKKFIEESDNVLM